jgi:imidazolonepropionase-like amidohydrolase
MKALIGGRLIDGKGSVMNDCVVIFDEDRIIEVGTKLDVTIPNGTEIIDITGKTALPGLINAHVHMVLDGSADPITHLVNETDAFLSLKAAKNASVTLNAGVTTVRDLGSRSGIDLALKYAINQGIVKGPRMFVSCNAVVMTGGHGYMFGREADGVDEVRKATREQLKSGADYIKIMSTGGVMTLGVEPGNPQFTYEEIAVAVEEAHKAGKRTATHAQGTIGIKNALRAGIDSVEHGIFLDEEAIELMKTRGTYLVPTLAAPYYILKAGVEKGIPDYVVKKTNTVTINHIDSVRKAYKAGVKIAAGTDAGTPYNLHGSMVIELKLLIDQGGLSHMDAITAATSGAAECMGLSDIIGTIDRGKLADVIVVEGDPLQDIMILDKVIYVFKGGKRIR